MPHDRIKDSWEGNTWLLQVHQALVVPPCHPSHPLSLKQLCGNTCSSDPLSLVEVIALLLGCASDGDPNRNFGPFTLHMVQLQCSSMPVQSPTFHHRITQATSQDVHPLNPPFLQH
ncbi:hypothetical protein VZT92_004666 [Zoarces viviparus]|uniref:Uncharacterized protein n=1 Tax=Zoarces viviparus TaxID=48416 RepID=A0AAW1FX80_ZOAVI